MEPAEAVGLGDAEMMRATLLDACGDSGRDPALRTTRRPASRAAGSACKSCRASA